MYLWQSQLSNSSEKLPSGDLTSQQPCTPPQPLLSFGQISRYADGIPQACTVWDSDWDLRDTGERVVPPSSGEAPAPKRGRRHLLLVRHGQYELNGESDEQRKLTQLGHQQATLTGRYLASLGVPFTCLIHSTMMRATQTSQAIADLLPSDVRVVSTDLLREGAPFPPEPRLHSWRPSTARFYADSARIEAAFRKFVHRASADQREDTHELLVCHANVIRYFVCRALQLPPEAWARISLRHASVTQLTVLPSGRVKLDFLGDASFMPVDAQTTT